MKNFRIPFSGVGASYTDNEINSVVSAMTNLDTLTQGKYQSQFEELFSNFVDVKYCFATSSAATALELAAQVIGLKSGDEVVCPAHTYNASAYPFAKNGAKLVWADIDKDTWLVSVEELKRVVTAKTKAIVVVHLYGSPANMEDIVAYAKTKGILVIEDCAQAIGATYSGKMVGSFGDISVFSFHSHKNISTLGEGGMFCTNDQSIAKLIPGLRHNGHSSYIDRDERYYWIPAMSNVDEDIPGVWPNNFCIGEVQCALGSAMLPRVTEINNFRRDRFNLFRSRLSEYKQITFQKLYPKAVSTHHLLPFKLNGKNVKRDLIIEKLAYEYKIQAIVQYYPLNRYPLFIKKGYGNAVLPNTNEYFDNMISLPFHHWMDETDFNYMTDSVINCIEKYVE